MPNGKLFSFRGKRSKEPPGEPSALDNQRTALRDKVKLYKKNESALNIRVVHDHDNESNVWSPLSQDTNDTLAKLNEEVNALRELRAKHAASSQRPAPTYRPQSHASSLVSKFGLKINTESNLPNGADGEEAGSNQRSFPLSHGSSVGNSILSPGGPLNKMSSIEEMKRFMQRPREQSMIGTELYLKPKQTLSGLSPSSSSEVVFQGRASKDHRLDSSAYGEQRSVNQDVEAHGSDSSPADSAVIVPNANFRKSYTGKGKARVVDDRSALQKLGDAVDEWLQRDEDVIDDRLQIPGSDKWYVRRTSRADASPTRTRRRRTPIQDDWIPMLDSLLNEEDGSEARKSNKASTEVELSDYILAAQMSKESRLEQEESDRIHAQELDAHLRREEEAWSEAEQTRARDCIVCGDSKPPLDFPQATPTAKCDHPPQTCTECLQSWMGSQIEEKGSEGIQCPECSQILEYNEVQQSASAENFETYDRIATRNALGSLEEFAWCLKPGCGCGQLNIDNNDFMDCVSCGYKQCLKHKVPWHVGETCAQYEYRTSGQKARDEERQTQEMLDEMSKKCPGPNCGWRLQKIGGCEHMTCKKCKHEFCWLCLASFQEIKRIGNTAHATTCKFHSHNIDLAWPFNVH